MRLSTFPNTYAEVIPLRLCEININAFLGKQMPIMPRYNSRLPVPRTVASNYQEENVCVKNKRKMIMYRYLFGNFSHTTQLLTCVTFTKFSILAYTQILVYCKSQCL